MMFVLCNIMARMLPLAPPKWRSHPILCYLKVVPKTRQLGIYTIIAHPELLEESTGGQGVQ